MDKFPAWRYGPNGQSGVFESEDDVPKGWVDHPTKVKSAEPAPSTSDGKPIPKKAGRPSKKSAAPLDL